MPDATFTTYPLVSRRHDISAHDWPSCRGQIYLPAAFTRSISTSQAIHFFTRTPRGLLLLFFRSARSHIASFMSRAKHYREVASGSTTCDGWSRIVMSKSKFCPNQHLQKGCDVDTTLSKMQAMLSCTAKSPGHDGKRATGGYPITPAATRSSRSGFCSNA